MSVYGVVYPTLFVCLQEKRQDEVQIKTASELLVCTGFRNCDAHFFFFTCLYNSEHVLLNVEER